MKLVLLQIALGVLVVAMALALVRALLGPTVKNRILAANSFGSITVLWLAIYSFVSGRSDFLDIAMIYALTSFVVGVAVLKYVERGDLGVGPEDAR